MLVSEGIEIHMEALAFLLTASALYAAALSVGYGRDFDDHIVTRPLVVGVGIALVVIFKEWGDWQAMQEWFVWFFVASIPQVIRVGIIYVKDDKRAKLKVLGIHSSSSSAQKEQSR